MKSWTGFGVVVYTPYPRFVFMYATLEDAERLGRDLIKQGAPRVGIDRWEMSSLVEADVMVLMARPEGHHCLR